MDIIQLLPDSIANQIAAGEVIQRPASAIKELMENAIDAGANIIDVYVEDAGKSMIRVIDNGKGMSETDARMCFERHATSKIKKVEDLFHIKTMGFRGEALASIAAVAQIELKTKRKEDELGTFLEIENSMVTTQEPCATSNGTNIAMKNLFFNIPARRNFLKSNAAELRHIIDEFIRVALAFPNISFSLHDNGQERFHLEAGSHKQRILQLLGNHLNPQLASVKEETEYMNITGFIGKPEVSKKTRGDQYFFVNNRFIKSSYLNHAVTSAFSGLLPKENFPLYVLFIELDPTQIDINVHPTKQEIKFENEQLIYAFVQAAIKHTLAKSSIAPSLDFDLDSNIQQLPSVNRPLTEATTESIKKTNLFQSFIGGNKAHFIESSKKESNIKHWQDFYNPSEHVPSPAETLPYENIFASASYDLEKSTNPTISILPEDKSLQILNSYIVATTTTGFVLVHQQLAHERILYEKFAKIIHSRKSVTQQLLLPITLELSVADSILLEDLLEELQQIGYKIEPFGKDTFIIQGVPADVAHHAETEAIELLLEQYKHFSSHVTFSKRERLLRCFVKQQSLKTNKKLSQEEINHLLQELLQCENSSIAVNGEQPIYIEYNENTLKKLFGR